jgi:aldose 1-epimerase
MEIEKFVLDGETLIKATSKAGLSLTLTPFGAGIYEIRYLGEPMSVASKDIHKYLNSQAYYGKTVGRIAGRIPNGQLTFEGKTYQLDRNEGKNTLHGGSKGLSFQPFKFEINDVDGTTAFDFFHDSTPLESGLPGNVHFQVRYLLPDDEPFFRIEYRYMSDEDCPINLTTHLYFNLNGGETIENQTLYLKADECEHYDATLVPLGMIKCPPCLDFSTPKPIGQDINDPLLYEVRTKGYDHAYKFMKHPECEATVRLESSKTRMDIITSSPAIQVYSGNYPGENNLLNNNHMDVPHSAVALEPVFIPGDFTSMKAKAHELVKTFSEYHFFKKEN